MRAVLLVALVATVATTAFGDAPPADQSAPAVLGYAVGYRVGRDFQADARAIDAEALLAGLRDALEGATPRWTAEEMRAALQRLEASQERSAAGATPEGAEDDPSPSTP